MFIKEQIMNGVKMNFARIVPIKALINEMRNDTINDLKNILELSLILHQHLEHWISMLWL